MATAVFVIAATSLAFTDGGQRRFREFLNGLKEAPAVISTTGTDLRVLYRTTAPTVGLVAIVAL